MVRGYTALLPSLTFDWSDLDASGSLQLVMVPWVCLAHGNAGRLVVRVHDNELGSADDSTFALVLEGRGHSVDDPARFFVGAALTTIALTTADAAGSAKIRELRWPWPSAAQLRVAMTQSARPETNRVRLSVALVLDGLCTRDEKRGEAVSWATA